MMRNLSDLLLQRSQERPDLLVGMVADPWSLSEAVSTARCIADALGDRGVTGGATVAVVGRNSMAYLLTWMSLQLAGAQTALINPDYPPDFIDDMLSDLEPDFVAYCDPGVERGRYPVPVLDTAGLAQRVLKIGADEVPIPAVHSAVPAGAQRARLDIAGYMHTSGTTGRPKFCAQSHEYFLRLGRFFADSLCLSPEDVVLAPLPMFHINPLGYGLIGGLTGYSSVLTAERFSASAFWEGVQATGATVLVMHAPPIEILKRRAPDVAPDHTVRAMFFADDEFLRTFRIPAGLSCYGSTEAGGLSHLWTWRRGESHDGPEPMSRVGGRPRYDIEWKVEPSGEIMVRETEPGALFSGYRAGGDLRSPFDADGWFATGDLGRIDDSGRLVFIERMAESIRVKGEYVPISFVEEAFGRIDGLDDLAVASTPSALVDDDLLLYVTCSGDVPFDAIAKVSDSLAAFMRPSRLRRVHSIPRDTGVGKVRRRELVGQPILEEVEL